MGPARQARRERGGKDGTKQPEQSTQPLAAERPMTEQPIAPHPDRQEQRQRAQAQQLHHQIGGDRTGTAEEIVYTRIRRVAERGVIHGPGRERECRHHRETEESDAAHFAQPPPESGAELAGEKGHPVKAAVDHRHAISLTVLFCSSL